MKNQLDIFQRAPQGVIVGEAAMDKVNVAAYLLKIFAVSGRQVIDDAHLGAIFGEG
jgi:hypothetical protein